MSELNKMIEIVDKHTTVDGDKLSIDFTAANKEINKDLNKNSRFWELLTEDVKNGLE
jgi:hypothetical protein